MEKIFINQLVVADDLTGANDTGVHFVSCSEDVIVIMDIFSETTIKPASTTVVSSDSRFLSPQSAYENVRNIMLAFLSYQPKKIYKKIDSTLRGNVGSEIDAMLDVTGYEIACVASASPRNGRTVRDGICFVHETPVSETEIGKDPFTPVLTSSVVNIIGSQTKRCIMQIPLQVIRTPLDKSVQYLLEMIAVGAKIFVTDAETSDDLKRVYTMFSMVNEQVLYVGSAGLFHAMNGNVAGMGEVSKKSLVPMSQEPKTLVVVGSLMKRTMQQVTYLNENHKIRIHQINTSEILKIKNDAYLDVLLAAISESFKESSTVVLKTDRKYIGNPEMATQVGAALGNLVQKSIEKIHLDVLVVTGGDTAKNVLKKIGVNSYRLLGEVLPGVPLAKIQLNPKNHEMLFVTKAGSYGEPDVLKQVVDFIQIERKD